MITLSFSIEGLFCYRSFLGEEPFLADSFFGEVFLVGEMCSMSVLSLGLEGIGVALAELLFTVVIDSRLPFCYLLFEKSLGAYNSAGRSGTLLY